jgi:hypothetical protein
MPPPATIELLDRGAALGAMERGTYRPVGITPGHCMHADQIRSGCVPPPPSVVIRERRRPPDRSARSAVLPGVRGARAPSIGGALGPLGPKK